MKKYISILAIAASLLAVSCKEDALEPFGDEHFVHFKQESSKAYRFSFAMVTEKENYTYKIPVTLIGKALTADATYSVEVVKDGEVKTTASDAVFTLPSAPTFRKGIYEDTLAIQFHNMAELNAEKTIVLKIVSNESFRPGPGKYQTAVIYISNTLTQPSWWDTNMSTVFLGDYSDIKFGQFIIATGISDMTNLTTIEIQAYVTQFIYYLRDLDAKGETVYEKNNITKVLDTIPYSSNV